MEQTHKVKTDFQEWIERRVDSVREKYTAYQCLVENGMGESLADEFTPIQIACPLPEHGPDRRPSARYYPGSGFRSYDHVHCFKCKVSLDSINLYAKLKGSKFMDALSTLERRFGLKIPRRPEPLPIAAPLNKDFGYTSERWSDIPTVLEILEKKLGRIHEKCSMVDYIKFCRVIDAVQWDYDKTKVATVDMASALSKIMGMMDDYVSMTDMTFQDDNGPVS